MTEDDLKTNSDFLVTESTIDRRLRIDDVVSHLCRRRTSGTLCVDLQDGGIRAVRLKEQTKMPEEARTSVRKILRMK